MSYYETDEYAARNIRENMYRLAKQLRDQEHFVVEQSSELERFLASYRERPSSPPHGAAIQPTTSVLRLDFEDVHSMGHFLKANPALEVVSKSFNPRTGMYAVVVKLRQPYGSPYD